MLIKNSDGASNSTSGIFCWWILSPTYTIQLNFLTIATTGDAQDFGDLTVAKAMAGDIFINSICNYFW